MPIMEQNFAVECIDQAKNTTYTIRIIAADLRSATAKAGEQGHLVRSVKPTDATSPTDTTSEPAQAAVLEELRMLRETVAKQQSISRRSWGTFSGLLRFVLYIGPIVIGLVLVGTFIAAAFYAVLGYFGIGPSA